MTPFDDHVCTLGEGALWHPERQELFWFDIHGRRLFARGAEGPARHWDLPQMGSAAGWIDDATLLVATETGLARFDIASGALDPVVAIEADNPATRSNDGRADPWGGFWVGTMGKAHEPRAGAIYRHAGGELRQLFDQVTVPNAICFAPDRSCAYFADTARGRLNRVALDAEGWPVGPAERLVDFRPHGLWPDGAVTDAEGTLWVALWGAGAVLRVAPDGTLGDRVALPAPRVTCPAFGGAEFTTLLCTSAQRAVLTEAADPAPQSGMTFALPGAGRGLAEPRVRLAGAPPAR